MYQPSLPSSPEKAYFIYLSEIYVNCILCNAIFIELNGLGKLFNLVGIPLHNSKFHYVYIKIKLLTVLQ